MESQASQDQPKKNVGRITDRLSSGAVWIMSGRVFMVSSLMVHTIVLARLLDPAMFGLAAIATAIAAIIEMSTKQSLTSALVQLPKVTKEHLDTAFTLNLIRGAIIGTVLMALAYPVSTIYDEPEVYPMLVALALSTSLYGISNPMLYIFTKELIFWQEFARTVCERSAVMIVSVAIAYYFRTPWAIIAGVAAGQFSLVFSSFFFAPYRPSLCLKKYRDLLSFSVWVTLSQFLQAVIGRMDQLLVGYVLGNAALGILTVSTRLAEAPTKETSAPLLKTAFPGFAKLKHNRDDLRKGYQRVQSLNFLISWPVALGLVMVAEPAVLLLLGEKWAEGVLVVQLLAGGFGLQAMATAVNPLAMAIGETKVLFMRTLFNTALRVVFILTGLFTGGLVGLLIARLLHAITAVIVNMTLVRKFLGLSHFAQIAISGRTIIASLVMVGVLLGYGYLVPSGTTTTELAIELASKIALGGASYVLAITVIWMITKKDGPEQELLQLAGKMLKRYFAKSPKRDVSGTP